MNIWKKTNIKKIQNNKINYKPFNNSIWQNKILSKINRNKKDLKSNYSNFFLSNSPLPLLILGSKKKKIKIVDYGSGDQEVLFQLISFKFKNKKILIDSIEVENITRLLKKKINVSNKNIKIKFYENFDFKKKYDFVHISDSLQYNLDWKIFLKKIASKKHEYIVLNNLTAGNFKTYISEQKFYKDKLPYIFFNEKEITKIFSNYSLYRYLYLNKINGLYQEYPQENFKKIDRIKYPKTLIFIRKK